MIDIRFSPPQFQSEIGIVGVHNKHAHSTQNTIQQLQKDGTFLPIRGSFRYRTWPWADKKWIEEEIMNSPILNHFDTDKQKT